MGEIPLGSRRNAWPQYLGRPASEVKGLLENSNEVPHVYVQPPAQPEESPPFNAGGHDDVWLYTDDQDNVVEIPQRGTWHPNRLSPGWPELVGTEYKAAIETILADLLGVVVVYGPDGFARTLDYRTDRVFLDVDDQGKVARVPRRG